MFTRTIQLIGEDNLQKLKSARVAVFGIGGVGGYVVEMLARVGVGALDLVDSDRVSVSNINRQIIALRSTVGEYKTQVAAARVRDINPDCKVQTHEVFFLPENADEWDFSCYDYVVDAVDTVSAKIALIQKAKEVGVPVISCMGTGNKMHPDGFEVADIAKTSVCPLARVMRRELKKRGIEHCKVVYSKEQPYKNDCVDGETGKPIPASIAFVPPAAGLLLAAEVVADLLKKGVK